MTKSPAKSELTDLRHIIEREERLSANCSLLCEKYGRSSANRIVVEHYDSVEADEAKLLRAIESARSRNARELHILIDGRGGLSTSMRRIVDALESYKGLKRGIVVGTCSSASAVVFAACDERIASPTATFLIHSCGFYADSKRYPYTPPRYTAASLDREVSRLAQTDIKIQELLFQRTGSRALAEMVGSGADHRLSAAEARELNLVTRVEPNEPISDAPQLRYRPRVATANRIVAEMVWATGRGGRSYTSIRIHGEIGRGKCTNAKSVCRQLADAPYAKKLVVFINSNGGNFAEASSIYTALREHPAKSKEAVIWKCESAAILPMIACDLRVAKPETSILLHSAALSPWEHREHRWTGAHHRLISEAIEALDDELINTLTERTGWERQWFVDRMKSEKPIALSDALQVGLIHQIDGVTPAPDPSWPDKAKALLLSGAPVMMSRYLFTENYFAACRAKGAA